MDDHEQMPVRTPERPLRKPNPYIEFAVEWLRMLSWTAWILMTCGLVAIMALTYGSAKDSGERIAPVQAPPESVVIPQESQDPALSGDVRR